MSRLTNASGFRTSDESFSASTKQNSAIHLRLVLEIACAVAPSSKETYVTFMPDLLQLSQELESEFR